MKLLKKNYSSLVLGVLFLAWIIGYFDKNAINVASIAIAKEFRLNSNQIGLIMSSFFMSYAFMSLIGGYLVDRFGSKKIITGIMVLWSIFTFITGMAWSFTSLILIRFMFGACEGGFPSASSVTIAELFAKEKRARAKSFLVSASSVGTALGTLVVASITSKIGWRSAFSFFGICGVIISILFFLIFRKMRIKCKEIETKTVKKVPLKCVFKIPFVWKLAIMQFSLGVFMWGLNSWMPTYWVKVKHLNIITMGELSSIPWIISFFCMNFSGWVLDKFMEGREKVFLSVIFAITGVFTYLMYTAKTVPLAFFYLTITTIAASVASPAIFVMPLKYMKKELIGTATGITNFGQQLAGILAPSIMGYLITIFNGSYSAVFKFVIFTVIIAFIVALTIDTSKYVEKDSITLY